MINNLMNSRNLIFNYYKGAKGALIMQKINRQDLTFKDIPKNNFVTTIKEEINPLNCIGDQVFSKNDRFEKVGKYFIHKDENNNIIYSNNNNIYYKKNKNKKINNFQTSYSGFANIGNSCYMNSFLQILLHTPNFLNILDEYPINQLDNNSLIYNLYYLSKYPFNPEYLFNIKKIMEKVNYVYGTKEPGDSQRFAIDFIDKLISESKNENSLNISINENYNNINEKFNSFIDNFNNKMDDIEKLFQFVEVSRGISAKLDNFSLNLHVELNFPQNYKAKMDLKDLLNLKYNEKSKVVDLPEILIISFNRGIIGKKLIKTIVSFGPELEFEKYIDKTLVKDSKSTKYILYGINERYGNFKNQGHYTCFIKIKKDEKNSCWRYYSDLYVIDQKPNFNSPDVYGLYYYREYN